jgi:hypothetical protein
MVVRCSMGSEIQEFFIWHAITEAVRRRLFTAHRQIWYPVISSEIPDGLEHSFLRFYYCWTITMEMFFFSMWFVPKCYKQGRSSCGVTIPYGGGVECLHRSPATRRRRRKGNPVSVGIIGTPCSWEIKIRGPGPPGWGNLESEAIKCGHESRGTWIWK